MAVVSSHILNGADGTHAAGVRVLLSNMISGEILFDEATDEGGRLSRKVDITGNDPVTQYELRFMVGAHWDQRKSDPMPIAREIVFRFVMPVPAARYHMPVILSPNSYACWMSNPEH